MTFHYLALVLLVSASLSGCSLLPTSSQADPQSSKAPMLQDDTTSAQQPAVSQDLDTESQGDPTVDSIEIEAAINELDLEAEFPDFTDATL